MLAVLRHVRSDVHRGKQAFDALAADGIVIDDQDMGVVVMRG